MSSFAARLLPRRRSEIWSRGEVFGWQARDIHLLKPPIVLRSEQADDPDSCRLPQRDVVELAAQSQQELIGLSASRGWFVREAATLKQPRQSPAGQRGRSARRRGPATAGLGPTRRPA
jgi:hypothetical protein